MSASASRSTSRARPSTNATLRGSALAVLAAAIAAACLVMAGDRPALAVEPSALAQIVDAYDGREFLLKVDLHQPEPRGKQAPWVDSRGWHRHDQNRPVVLAAGDRVQVTGVFNYGDKGVFLEISRRERWRGGPARPRVRIRFMAEAEPEDPDLQATQIQALIAQVLSYV